MKKVAVIMAGGLGVRLWPNSTESKPKQYMSLFGNDSMIQETYNRLLDIFANEDIYVVTYKSFAVHTQEQLPNLPSKNIILEPFGRNTLPALGIAALHIQQRYNSNIVMFSFPSDHIIGNQTEFKRAVETASKVASNTNGIVTIGINPTRPGTQYGYIQINEEKENIEEYFDLGVRSTNVFAEKPDLETAKRFLESGDFLWNSGIFAWKLEVFWNKLEKYLPEYSAQLKSIEKQLFTDSYNDAIDFIYKQINSISIDYGIMEKTDDLYLVKASFSWSDVGNWDELYRLSMKDSRNNVTQGDVVALDTGNSLIYSKNKMIATVGVEDLVIVESDDAILICKRGETERVKEMIDYLRHQQINRLL